LLEHLNPFLDDDGILRVGGRLKNAQVPLSAKHQIILPNHHQITHILLRRIHEENAHFRKE